MTKFTITEMIIKGDPKEEIMEAFHVSESEASELMNKVNNSLEDKDVTEEEFQELCDNIDAQY